MIRFENVTYTYPFSDACAVKDINLHVRPGELVLVSGESGCGKTTLMRLADGLCPGYFRGTLKGRVLIDGRDTSAMPLKDISRMVGTLFQDPEQQFFALGVEDELAFVHEWRGLAAEETREKVRRAADSFGLSPVLHHSIHELSEGQKQKVGLASILSQEPRALVLDEPTANLDPEATVELACRLRALKESGMAILVVDHRLYWLEGVADRVLVSNVQPTAEQMGGMGDWDLFMSGRLGMIPTGIWAFNTFADGCDFAWDVAIEPGMEQKATHFFSNACVVNAESENKEAAMTWITWLCSSPAAAEIRIEAGWDLPAINDEEVLASYLDLTPPENREVVFESLDYLVVPPVIEDYALMSDIIGQQLEAAAAGTVTVQEALDEAQAQCEAQISLG